MNLTSESGWLQQVSLPLSEEKNMTQVDMFESLQSTQAGDAESDSYHPASPIASVSSVPQQQQQMVWAAGRLLCSHMQIFWQGSDLENSSC